LMRHELLKDYEQSAANAAQKIFFVAEGGIEDTPAPDSLKSLAGANAFKGDAGAVLANDAGVLLGVGAGADAFIIAAAADKLPEGDYVIDDALDDDAATLACLGWLIGGYRFDHYKSQRPAVARLIAPKNADLRAARRAGDAVQLVRDLVNTPASDMTPEVLEKIACDIARDHDAEISITIGDELLHENFPMVHAVGRAAAVAPRLIDLTWGPQDAPKLTLVGKGVTFDSGGLNMKGAAGMALMKKDMGGSAHVLALSRMIMSAGLNVRLRAIIPAVENAVSGNAFRPGDILKSRKGLTVEIGNTDAEGRLILADALALGAEEEPDLMISLATLTGAARVALGPDLAPVYCDDDSLVCELESTAAQVADPVWRMPLWRGYQQMLSSTIADVNHISGGSFAGSVTAALFLQRFVPEGGRWMHFDLYAWRPKAAPGRPVGGEAQAIRALFGMIEARYAR
jgi:leucyl aminopeptidase